MTKISTGNKTSTKTTTPASAPATGYRSPAAKTARAKCGPHVRILAACSRYAKWADKATAILARYGIDEAKLAADDLTKAASSLRVVSGTLATFSAEARPASRKGGNGIKKELVPGCTVTIRDKARADYAEILSEADFVGMVVVKTVGKRVIVQTSLGQNFLPRGHVKVIAAADPATDDDE
jgi:hypothetical protein